MNTMVLNAVDHRIRSVSTAKTSPKNVTKSGKSREPRWLRNPPPPAFLLVVGRISPAGAFGTDSSAVGTATATSGPHHSGRNPTSAGLLPQPGVIAIRASPVGMRTDLSSCVSRTCGVHRCSNKLGHRGSADRARPREEDLYDAGQHAGQAGGGDSRSAWNRDRLRVDFAGRNFVEQRHVER